MIDSWVERGLARAPAVPVAVPDAVLTHDAIVLGASYRRHVRPACEWCGGVADLEVHHILPQSHFNAIGWPEFYDDARNLVTLCNGPTTRCHLLIGHLGHFATWNYALIPMLMIKQETRAAANPQEAGL